MTIEAGAVSENLFHLTLFVSGASDLSARAIAHARHLCDAHLAGRCQLSIIDVHDDPSAVDTKGVFATPTLVKDRPLPVRTIVGDLSNTDKVLAALDLPGAQDARRAHS